MAVKKAIVEQKPSNQFVTRHDKYEEEHLWYDQNWPKCVALTQGRWMQIHTNIKRFLHVKNVLKTQRVFPHCIHALLCVGLSKIVVEQKVCDQHEKDNEKTLYTLLS